MIWTIYTSSKSNALPSKGQKKYFFRSKTAITISEAPSNTLSQYRSHQKKLDSSWKEIVEHKNTVPEYFIANSDKYIFLKKQRIIIFLWVWEVLTRSVNFLFRKGKIETKLSVPITPNLLYGEIIIFIRFETTFAHFDAWKSFNLGREMSFQSVSQVGFKNLRLFTIFLILARLTYITYLIQNKNCFDFCFK